VSHAEVRDGAGRLAQAHFGLYAGARLAAGAVWNDDLAITEVSSEEDAMAVIAGR